MSVFRLLLLLLTLSVVGIKNTLLSQFNFVYNDSIVVIKGLDTIPLAWAGGMSHPQFSTIDLDFDGVEELVAFEPENNIVNVFKRQLEGGKAVYRYWHYGHQKFPTDIRYRVKLVDFDGDGKKDLFTYGYGGIKVYKNKSEVALGVQWEVFVDPIQTFYNGSYSNLHAPSNEIPSFVDVDGDGDIDILIFNAVVSRVEWHKNLSIETYGNADSLLFELEQPCWGDFIENDFGNAIELNSTQAPCGTVVFKSSGTQRHSGGALLGLDANRSGLIDLIIGDVEFNNLTLVINGGASPSDNALMVSYDSSFPSYDVPVDLSNFLTPYFEDFDLDGVNDIIVSTTIPGSSDNSNGVWLYKNKAANDSLDLEFIQTDFLQGDMIQNGKGAIPVLVDVNNDGLKDLLVANHYNYREGMSNSSRINYYLNVGSLTQPTFKLIDENWKNFANSGFTGRVSPAFGDLDGDGDLDMIVGVLNGRLYYYENAGGAGPMSFNIAHYQLQDNNGNNITVSNYATPELFDLDKDGKLDLIIGQGNGPLLYYRNIGTGSNFSFELTNSDLGMVDLTTSNYIQTIGVPRFTRYNDTTYLIAGNRAGTISFYDGIDGQISPGNAFNLVSSDFSFINTRGMSAPIMGQLRNDNSFDLFVGTETGGLWSYRPGDTAHLSVDNESEISKLKLTLYPNPTKGDFVIELEELNGQKYDYRVLDPLGRTVKSQKDQSQSSIVVQLPKPTSGLYFVEVTIFQSQQRITKKLLVE
ncbi:MAG TPA: FG-GAP-like repeat-containing protein [Brumimicrobium sp.]|nr:FG-GAP-like repeat-containing protein [Brumimicrobium sp.]